MFAFQRVKIRSYEVGLHFRDGEYRGLLGMGSHWRFDPLGRHVVQVVSRRAPQLFHEKLDLIVAAGELKGLATVVDLKDDHRGLVWIDGRFCGILPPGLYAYWLGLRDVRVEVVDAGRPRFEHEALKVIARWPGAAQHLDLCKVGRGCVGVLFVDGSCRDELPPASTPSGRGRPTPRWWRWTSARRRSTWGGRRS